MQYKTTHVAFVRANANTDLSAWSDDELAQVIANAKTEARALRKVRRVLKALAPLEDETPATTDEPQEPVKAKRPRRAARVEETQEQSIGA